MRKALGALVTVALLALGAVGFGVTPCEPWVDPCPQADPPCYDCEAGGLFLGLEFHPAWCYDAHCVVPMFTVGWEGRPVGHYWTSWTAMFGMDNPVVLDGWYYLSAGVLVNFPRSYNVRFGGGVSLHAELFEGQLYGFGTDSFYLFGMLQFNAGGLRLYAKPALPFPLLTDEAYLGASLILGAYIVVPELFPRQPGG